MCIFSSKDVVDVCFGHMPPVQAIYAQAPIHKPTHQAKADPLHCLYVVAMDGTDAETIVTKLNAALAAEEVRKVVSIAIRVSPGHTP